MDNIRGQTQQKCPVCGTAARLKHRHCTCWGRLKVLHPTLQSHECHNCGAAMMVDVFRRDARDIWLEVAIAIGGLLLLCALAAFLVLECPR